MIADRQLNLDDSYRFKNLHQNKFLLHVYDESNRNNMIFILETVLPISQQPFIAQTHVNMQNKREDTIFLQI